MKRIISIILLILGAIMFTRPDEIILFISYNSYQVKCYCGIRLIITFGIDEGQWLKADQLVCGGSLILTHTVSLQSFRVHGTTP